LYATSANPSGGPAPRTLEDVDPTIRGGADFAVQGRPGSGEASAVVDLSGGRARVLRPTAELTEEWLSRLATEAVG
ncbi:MAG: Sua5/YciO/YrdC/YwlC family protein, partial [Actinobacteria bacterium]|nr:Sua5/YciO/YrdC/YwlC family protein [Actinomycetota bacterium]